MWPLPVRVKRQTYVEISYRLYYIIYYTFSCKRATFHQKPNSNIPMKKPIYTRTSQPITRN